MGGVKDVVLCDQLLRRRACDPVLYPVPHMLYRKHNVPFLIPLVSRVPNLYTSEGVKYGWRTEPIGFPCLHSGQIVDAFRIALSCPIRTHDTLPGSFSRLTLIRFRVE